MSAADNQFDADRGGPRFQQIDGLRKDGLIDKKPAGLFFRIFARCEQQVHGLGGGSSFIQKGGIGNLHARQVHHHRLEIDERLKPSLRNFSLVRCIGCVPARILENVAKNYTRRVGVIVTCADVGFENLVLGYSLFEMFEKGGLRQGIGEVEALFQTDRRRNSFFNELVDRSCLDHL